MNNTSLFSKAIVSGLLVASGHAYAEDKRICSQPFGYDSVSKTYQVITVSCENMESILSMHPWYRLMPTKKNTSTGEQFTQINDKDANPIFWIYIPARKRVQNPNSQFQ